MEKLPVSMITGILSKMGGTYVTGAVCSSVYYFITGVYKSPKGQRIAGGNQTMREMRENTHKDAAEAAKYAAIHTTLDYMREAGNIGNENNWKINRFVTGVAAGVIKDGPGAFWGYVIGCGIVYGGIGAGEYVWSVVKESKNDDKMRLLAMSERDRLRFQAMMQHDQMIIQAAARQS